MRSGVGLMGEAGPEAVLPLKRIRNGDLGVKAERPSITIINNNNSQIDTRETPNGLEIELRAVSMAKRAIVDDIMRGGSPVSKAIECTYLVRRNGR
ncbi:phage tail tape measure protein [Erythrobacter dokdonensis]|uniref:Putative phage tail minor protein n=1 Tax=Erythrobacter dokdonensis DSW-74 TaxID=1300349 RepID=A0A1A7BGF2_9SPHN|nr:phage tail tape measure protein [Erythrobacter dokdonensis]OBV11569.1 putative phage tail minor protein [Erythrobacter dokdonensis DSW-74]